MVYSNLRGIPSSFLVSTRHSTIILFSLSPAQTRNIEVLSSTRNPYVVGYDSIVEGRYVISGRVLYNRKITADREAILNVRPRQGDLPIYWIVIIGLGYVIALFIALYLIMLFRKKNAVKRHY
ncbi:MAG: hypothetical protein ACMXYL_02695 [Candidatus Woesearchaeota archaeon]